MPSQSTRTQIVKAWHKLINPQDLEAAFIFTVLLLRVAGLFPYVLGESGFEISRIAFAVTLLHFSVYAYVNINVLFTDLMMLAKPIIVDSDLAIGANIIIRVVGIVITVAIFFPIFTGIGGSTGVLNRYVLMMELLGELGIKTGRTFKKMLFMSAISTLITFLITLYLLAHSYVFYEKIANEKASMRFFYVLILANYYKNMSLFSMGSYLFSTYLMLTLFNAFLKDLLHRQMKENEVWSRQFDKIVNEPVGVVVNL